MADISKIKLPDGQTYDLKASKLATPRTLNVGGQATGTAQSFNGSANVTIPITSYNTQGLARPSALRGTTDNTLQALFNTTRANRLAFLPADQIIIEKTTDGGVTWVDAEVSNAAKLELFSEVRRAVPIPQIDGVRSPLCGIRVTFTAMKYNVPENTPETEKYNYWSSTYVKSAERYNQLKDFYFWISASDGSIKIKIEGAKGSAANNWETLFDDPSYYMTGWSGSDYIHLSVQRLFGGNITQTSNAYWNYRMTFMSWGKNGTDDFNTGSKTQIQNISEIRGYGDSWWVAGNGYAGRDRIYSHDKDQNVTFPAKVTASSFAGQGGDLTALNGSNITQGTVAADRIANLDASKIASGTLPVARGGTGQTTAANAANAFMNALGTGSATPQDADYYISQYAGGGTTTTTYHRRPMSALWEWIKGKISSVLGLTASDYNGSAARVNGHTVAVDVPSGAKFTDTTYDIATVNNDGLMSAADKTHVANIETRLSDVEDTLANIDLSDADAVIMALALRVSALESHALLDDGYPNIIVPLVHHDATTNTLYFA